MITKQDDLINIKDASLWATKYLGKNVTVLNISYLIQYGRIKKYGENGNTLISKGELQEYYNSYNGRREKFWQPRYWIYTLGNCSSPYAFLMRIITRDWFPAGFNPKNYQTNLRMWRICNRK